MLTGKHLIDGTWIASSATFESSIVDDTNRTYFAGSPELIDKAVQSAQTAFASYSGMSRARLADVLKATR